jgi:hypothetical protein
MSTTSRSERERMAAWIESQRPSWLTTSEWEECSRAVHDVVHRLHTPGVTARDKTALRVALSLCALHEQTMQATPTHEDRILAYLRERGAVDKASGVRAREVALHCSPDTVRPSTPYAIMGALVVKGVLRRTYGHRYTVWLA